MKFSKEEFVKCINDYEWMCEVNCKAVNGLGIWGEWVFDDVLNKYYELFHDVCGILEYQGYDSWLSWVDWYCFETNFGKEEGENEVCLSDDESLVIDSPEILYDFIVNHIDKK